MPEFFAHADALLVSLKSDALFEMTVPGKLQAYLASGIPVLAMLDGEGAELLAEAGAGLSCPSGNGHALAEIAEHLAQTDRAARQAMGQRGRDYCTREFSFGRLVSSLEASLARLADGQR
jgi:glycosyltransferase involved in cell wall biosynthesis